MCVPYWWCTKHAQWAPGRFIKTLRTTDLKKKKTFHLIKYLLATFIFFPFFSICTCSLLPQYLRNYYLYSSLVKVTIVYAIKIHMCKFWREIQNDQRKLPVFTESIKEESPTVPSSCPKLQTGLMLSLCGADFILGNMKYIYIYFVSALKCQR